MPLHRFGDASVGKLYDFTTAGRVFLGVYKDNFAQVDSITHKSPGMSGAFDAYGQGVPPTKVGNIRQELELRATSLTSIDTYRDELRAMVSWGKQRLYFRPENYPTQADRTCYAKCVKVDMSIDKQAHNLIQKVTIEWEVNDPRWIVPLSAGGEWGVAEWGTGDWGDAQYSGNFNDGFTINLTYNGNTPSTARIEFETDNSLTMLNPGVQRVVNGEVVEYVQYNDLLPINTVLVIDARKHSVKRNGIDAYDPAVFTHRTATWMTVVPGFNIFTGLGYGNGLYRFYYDEAYR